MLRFLPIVLCVVILASIGVGYQKGIFPSLGNIAPGVQTVAPVESTGANVETPVEIPTPTVTASPSPAAAASGLAGPISPTPSAKPSPTPIPTPVVNNTPPGAGYSRQSVKTDIGTFTVSIVAADLGSTKVIVDTASTEDCRNDCPVLSLGDYVARNGAYAGINGSYFCPATYPACADKKNSFDTLLMNKDKRYFNSDNNVYSTLPLAAFGAGWATFHGQTSSWGRDTGVDAVIANQPMLVQGGNNAFAGSSDAKQTSRGPRSFIGNKGSTVYIGVVSSATVGESAKTLHTMGLENALNLDSGGSTALWSGGYKAGPGRAIPNAVLFVKR
ncbi:MAG: phosphodiester glycosidase family protein [bacterium]|nr:phosphodiester glycosidase family protein [bacterium]